MFEQCCSVSKRFEKLGQLLSLFPPPLRPWPFFGGRRSFLRRHPVKPSSKTIAPDEVPCPTGWGPSETRVTNPSSRRGSAPPLQMGAGGGPRDHPRRSYPRGIYLCGEPSPVPTEVRLELSGSKGQRAHGSKGAAPRPWVDLSDPWLLHA